MKLLIANNTVGYLVSLKPIRQHKLFDAHYTFINQPKSEHLTRMIKELRTLGYSPKVIRIMKLTDFRRSDYDIKYIIE